MRVVFKPEFASISQVDVLLNSDWVSSLSLWERARVRGFRLCCSISVRSSMPHAMLLGFLNRSRLNRMVMVAPRNPQHAPQHGGSHGQPAGNQHHNGHGQAHQCLLFALHRAHTFSIRSVSVTV
jgi:hypothetical protein